MVELLESTYLGNTILRWSLAALIAITTVITLKMIMASVVRALNVYVKATNTEIDDFVADLLRRTKFFFLVLLSVYAGSLVLTMPHVLDRALRTTAALAVLAQGAIWVNALIAFWLTRYVARRLEHDAAQATTVSALGFVIKLALWSVVLLLALDNLEVDVTAMVAGLGVGGIAVALAAQNILGDLFASLSIVLDRPFVIGDFIIVGDLMGSVERVGIKTTRVRSLWGEQLVFNNSDLLSSRIRNYKRMAERRIQFSLGVTYQTPRDKLVAIPDLIRQAIEEQSQTRFDRAHFKAYGAYSLDFEVVYYVLSSDYNVYMDLQQAINLSIHEKFEKTGIEFAYPTQTLFLEKPA